MQRRTALFGIVWISGCTSLLQLVTGFCGINCHYLCKKTSSRSCEWQLSRRGNGCRRSPHRYCYYTRQEEPFRLHSTGDILVSLEDEKDDDNNNNKKKKVKKKTTVGGRRERKEEERRRDYERRKKEWEDRYGSFEALQKTFGTSQSSSSSSRRHWWWSAAAGGDLDPIQTRKLYHTLLPRTLLDLYEIGVMKPEDLAPLAYRARIAAKQYARSRCAWTGRLVTALFDQYRRIIRSTTNRKGSSSGVGAAMGGGGAGGGGGGSSSSSSSSSSSMSWEEIWNKYEAQIVAEECTEELDCIKSGKVSSQRANNAIDGSGTTSSSSGTKRVCCSLTDDDLTNRIYLRILEKSCATNAAFDAMFLEQKKTTNDNDDDDNTNQGDHNNKNAAAVEKSSGNNNLDLHSMALKLDRDVREILLGPKEMARAVRIEERAKRKADKAKRKAQERQEKEKRKMIQRMQKDEEKEKKRRSKRLQERRRQQEKATTKNNNGVDETQVTIDTQRSAGTGNDVVFLEEEEEEEPPAAALITTRQPVEASTSDLQQQSRWQVLRIMAGSRRRFRLPEKEQ